jgi:hypothetical protein
MSGLSKIDRFYQSLPVNSTLSDQAPRTPPIISRSVPESWSKLDGWSDVTVGALFEMDFQGSRVNDLEIGGVSSEICTCIAPHYIDPSPEAGMRRTCASCGASENHASESDISNGHKNLSRGNHFSSVTLTNIGDDGKQVEEVSTASWASFTQRQTTTRSVAIVPRRRPKCGVLFNATH